MRNREFEDYFRLQLNSRFDHQALTKKEVADFTGYSEKQVAAKFSGWTGSTRDRRIAIPQLAKELAAHG